MMAYKAVMFLTLLILCVGSVCANDPDNSTNSTNYEYTYDKVSIDDFNNITNTSSFDQQIRNDLIDNKNDSYNKIDYLIVNNYEYYKIKISDYYLKANTTSLTDLKYDYDNLNNILDKTSNASNYNTSIVNNLTYFRNKVYHAFHAKIEAKDILTEDEDRLNKLIFKDWLLRNHLPYKAEQLYNKYYKYYVDKRVNKENPLTNFVKEKFKNKTISLIMSDLLNKNLIMNSNNSSSSKTTYDILMDYFNKKDKEIKRLTEDNNKLRNQINKMNSGLKDNTTFSDNHNLSSLLDELNSLIGLDNVKKSVNSSINILRINKMRVSAGLKAIPISLHLVFTGNPGTGKTTVARLVSKIYKELGILSKGQLVEKDRSGLIAEYTGQTPPKVMKVIDEAMGGVLFIDEAYTIVTGENDGYGKEAVATLLKAMEDRKGKFVVIVAGYPNEMIKFINSNPGFKSRFTQFIQFDDYSPEDMFTIFKKSCDEYNYILEPDAIELAKKYITKICTNKSKSFANARDIRNMFEHIIYNQANRISTMYNDNNILYTNMTTITTDDFKGLIIN